MKLSITMTLLIIAVLVGGACFGFNPAVPVVLILGFGISRRGCTVEPIPPSCSPPLWGSGYGVNFDRNDVWGHGINAGGFHSAHRSAPPR